MRKFFVTGIGTDVGKTFVSAILVEALGADYWKPVQTGSFYGTDRELIQKLISREDSILHSEVYNFEQPVSPHYAAAIANSKIEIDKILIPETQNKNMVIEGAGGVMVPIDEAGHFMIDLIEKLECEVVLVSQNYLGSINHSLLTIQAIHNRGLKIGTLIFNGPRNESSEKIIIAACQANKVKYVNKETIVGKETILKYSADFREI